MSVQRDNAACLESLELFLENTRSVANPTGIDRPEGRLSVLHCTVHGVLCHVIGIHSMSHATTNQCVPP